MRRIDGKVTLYGTVAYAPQNPWYGAPHLSSEHLIRNLNRLMGASIRDNILFSHEYDEAFYNLVLDGVYSEGHYQLNTAHNLTPLCIACALRPDLELFPNGDSTEVGEKGICFGLQHGVVSNDYQGSLYVTWNTV